MIILGIDPGLRFSGYGILKRDGKKALLIDHGFLKLPPTASLSVRIGMFYTFFQEKIITYQITDLGLETPFLGKNAQNFLKLGYLRGILYLLADQHSLTLHEFSPRQVKQAITGFGGADKEQVGRAIMRFFPALVTPGKADVTDALAVTLCCLWAQKSIANKI